MVVTTRAYSLLAIFLWMLIILGFMALAQVVNLEIFFVLWLIGVLVIIELTDPPFIEPRMIRHSKYLAAGGVILFGIIVLQKIMEIISS
ncbi:hypothetical protein L0665_10425 [Methanogenium marinum]|uniref:Uncharacterized protein n=1 Tax=Methanogenium marinum TaxID=348610 RepID=A0A9Q4KV62_9EURY|nr:hypothetical protein [Methanogenium marinum]MDE4909023.1 hypothetical protein [Methanogenium marinum]